MLYYYYNINMHIKRSAAIQAGIDSLKAVVPDGATRLSLALTNVSTNSLLFL